MLLMDQEVDLGLSVRGANLQGRGRGDMERFCQNFNSNLSAITLASRPIHTKRKRKCSFMFEFFSLIYFACQGSHSD